MEDKEAVILDGTCVIFKCLCSVDKTSKNAYILNRFVVSFRFNTVPIHATYGRQNNVLHLCCCRLSCTQ